MRTKSKINWVAWVIAIFLDVVDYVAFGWIPIIGDALDVLGMVLLYPFIGFGAFVGIIEFIPVIGDLMPSFILAVLAFQQKLFGKARRK